MLVTRAWPPVAALLVTLANDLRILPAALLVGSRLPPRRALWWAALLRRGRLWQP